jgi:hypothetical protein
VSAGTNIIIIIIDVNRQASRSGNVFDDLRSTRTVSAVGAGFCGHGKGPSGSVKSWGII